MYYYLDQHSEAIFRNNEKYNKLELPSTEGYIPGDIIILKNGNKYKLGQNKEWKIVLQ